MCMCVWWWCYQSSFYFQAKSCQNLIMGNIFFNGPRAGVNFNGRGLYGFHVCCVMCSVACLFALAV